MPNAIARVFIRRRQNGQVCQKKKVTMESEVGVMLFEDKRSRRGARNVGNSGSLKSQGNRIESSLETQKEHSPADTLTLVF